MIDEEDVDVWERMLTHCEWISIGYKFRVGDKVVRNNEFWDFYESKFYGAGVGVGEVLEVCNVPGFKIMFVVSWPEAEFPLSYFEEELSLECVGCTQLYES